MRRFLPAVLALAAACGDDGGGTGPGNPTFRTILYYREDTGRNFLLNSDGTALRVLAIADSGLVPVGHAPQHQEVAFLDGTALVVVNLNDPGRRDTLMDPIPPSISPVTFSPSGGRVAMFRYGPDPALLVFDRQAGIVDTLDTGSAVADLPPAFSPDGQHVALLSVTPISVILTIVSLAGDLPHGEVAGFARLTWQPVYGWPQWTEAGVLFVALKPGEDLDTLAVVAVDPVEASRASDMVYKVASPLLSWDDLSSYALASDGLAFVVASTPLISDRRLLYYAARGGRLNALLDDPAARPVFPLVLPASPAASAPSARVPPTVPDS